MSKGAFVMIAMVVLLLAQTSFSQGPSEGSIKEILNQLPPCSVLREDLEQHKSGEGIEQPYMQKMRQQGVKRALLDVDSVLHKGKPTDLQVVRRLYFRQYDGRDSAITDETSLKAIETSGLQAMLDEIAFSRVSAAPILRAVDVWHLPLGKQKSSFVEFFSEPWLAPEHVLLYQSHRSRVLLADTVIVGDVLGTQKLLGSRRFKKEELDRALFDAVLSRYDNSTVIRLLLDAGADVNARAHDGSTPLRSAVGRPCNLRPLLDRGADPGARDRWGATALDIARVQKLNSAIHVLEEAAAKTSAPEKIE